MPTHPDTDIITPRPKAAHTPGPWRAHAGGSETTFAIHGACPGAALATVFADSMRLIEEGKHNAILIAAAPDLLAALRLALPELAEDLIALVNGERIGGAADWQPEEPLPADLDSDGMDLIRAKKAAYDAVLAAIKQAEGR